MLLPLKQPFQYAVGTPREVGVNLKQGYNGDLTSREAGSIGGQMVKNVTTVRTLKISRIRRSEYGHRIAFTYMVSLTA